MKEPKASVTPKGDREKQARIEREAAALRENLRKRKEQARARAESRSVPSSQGGNGEEPGD
jgi:hypothetical protein